MFITLPVLIEKNILDKLKPGTKEILGWFFKPGVSLKMFSLYKINVTHISAIYFDDEEKMTVVVANGTDYYVDESPDAIHQGIEKMIIKHNPENKTKDEHR